MLKIIKNFFKYFFANSTRFVISTFIVILAIFCIYKNGFYDFVMILGNIVLACLGALIFSIIEYLIFEVIKLLWLNNLKGDKLLEKLSAALPYMFFANFCALLYLYCKGIVIWK